MEKTSSLLYVTMLVHCCLVACLAMRTTNITSDQSALLALKAHIILAPNHILVTNWTTNTPVCDWIGVTCNIRHRRVAALSIPDMGLTGTLPPHLGNLSFLVHLNIKNNSFHGDLPREMVNLCRLKIVNLNFCYFGGQIPSWLGALPELRFLSLANNSFTGTFPSSFFNLSKLENLRLANNHVSGKIPQVIGNLQNLKELDMQNNQLRGPIPISIFNISSLEAIALSLNDLSGNLSINMCNHLPKLKRLHLSWNNLDGEIPSRLYKCSELQVLSLSFNKFTGRIPSEIGNLTMLKRLYLGNNDFQGDIPQQLGNLEVLEILSILDGALTGHVPSVIFNMSSLKYIDFSNNSLSGSLPVNLCRNLPLLEELHLFHNKFTGGIPSSIGNCTLLKEVDVSVNNLSGLIPQEFGTLQSLEYLSIAINKLSGSIPPNIFNISTSKVICVAANQLSGNIPSNLGDWLPNIEELYLDLNKLTGIIPNSISNSSKLKILDFSSNSFSGFIPHTLGNLELVQVLNFENNNLTSETFLPRSDFINSLTKCKQLRRLGLSNNPLNINVPATIANLTYLAIFMASNCNVIGKIPEEIGNFSNLIALVLQYNDISGTIPATVGQLQKLQLLALGGNNLKGSIPNNICNLKGLSYLYLDENKLFGSLPTCIGNMSLLRYLWVNSNELTSAIPSTLWNLKDLLVINLYSNSLSGELPFDIGNLKVVTRVDISRNHIYGDIPSSIGSLQNLLNLSLAHNKFQGPIPISFGNLISLQSLDLSQNNLSGVIPISLEKLASLQFLNLSSNNLEGEIPKGGPFANFTAQSFQWNKDLCGMPQFKVRQCPNAHDRSRKTMVLVMKYILPTIASVILITLVLAFALLRCRKRKIIISDQEILRTAMAPRRFSYKELLQATSGFAEYNLLGTGSFSSVYKGTLSDSMIVAIKLFDLGLEGSLNSFDIECEVMRNVRHRNLIKVIGNCSNLDFKALVVDYMPNGSLEKWLYGIDKYLDILQRMSIIIDIASVLEYLHHGSLTPVVHCDIKPSNILLDGDMVAHLGDYGIAKLLNQQESTRQTRTLATIGYIAPEYGSEGIISTKCDVYSYGIMLLETFTRKRPTDAMFIEDMSLKNWVNGSLHHEVVEVIDTNILRKDDKDFSIKVHCIKSIMELAISCSMESPEERMNMKDVLNVLKKIKLEFLKQTHDA